MQCLNSKELRVSVQIVKSTIAALIYLRHPNWHDLISIIFLIYWTVVLQFTPCLLSNEMKQKATDV